MTIQVTNDNDNAVNNNGAAASVTITSAHNLRNPLLLTTTTTMSSLSMPQCVSITNTVPTICNTTPKNIDDFLMNLLQKLDSKIGKKYGYA